MIDSYARGLYQKIVINPLLPVASRLSPTTITCIAIVAGVAVLPLLAWNYSVLAFVMLLFSGFLDTLDGSIARFKNQSTSFGAALDITGDRLVEFCVVMGLYFFDPTERSIYCLLMLGSILLCITSFLVVGIFTQNTSEKGFYYSPGLMERAEAFIFFSVMILVPESFVAVSLLFSLLVTLTGFSRLLQFYKNTIKIDSKIHS